MWIVLSQMNKTLNILTNILRRMENDFFHHNLSNENEIYFFPSYVNMLSEITRSIILFISGFLPQLQLSCTNKIEKNIAMCVGTHFMFIWYNVFTCESWQSAAFTWKYTPTLPNKHEMFFSTTSFSVVCVIASTKYLPEFCGIISRYYFSRDAWGGSRMS